MSVTITVEATWRVSRIEIRTPYDAGPEIGSVFGDSEALLEDQDGNTTLGVMQGPNINRSIVAVGSDTVKLAGNDVTFTEVLATLNLFFEKWRLEDAAKPPDIPELPTATKSTEVFFMPSQPQYEDLPPPREPANPLPPEPQRV